MHGKARPRLSILIYVLLLMVLTLASLAVAGYYGLGRMDTLQQRLADHARQMAQEELNNALEAVALSVDRYLARLADWDEVRQQLIDPRYYDYWISYRALKGSAAPEWVRAFDLYDQNGQALGGGARPPLPARQRGGPYATLRKPAGEQLFRATRRVHGGAGGVEVLGYVAIDVDLEAALKAEGLFRHVDPASLRLELPVTQALELPAVMEHMRYSVEPNPGVQEMRALTEALLRQLALLLVLAAVAVFVMTAVLIVRPLRRLSNHIDELRERRGGLLLSDLGTPLAISELEKVRNSLNDYELELQNMHQHLDEKNRQLWTLAHVDPLTGTFNRRALEDDWAALQEASGEQATPAALLLFDCDHFKAINDTYGHQVGDMVIQGIAQAVQQALRRGDRLYRLGGDEFASLVAVDSPETAERVGRRCIQEVMRHDFRRYGLLEPVRISVGLSFCADVRSTTLEQLQREADSAMYTAKRPGHEHLAVYRPGSDERADSLLSNRIIAGVYEALEDPERLVMHYQPVMDLDNASTAYYEALARLRRDDELLMPSVFFPVVESHRLEREFDAAVLASVLADLRSGRVPAGTGVAINLAGPFLESPELVEALSGLRGFLPDYRIVLEITETLLITHMDRVADALNTLRGQGFVIALDDFGSGYSSLMYLARMPVDVIKFDISLTQALLRKDRQAGIIADLARMIRRAGYGIVAEGIEDVAQLEAVRELGFQYGQGNLLGRPERYCLVSRLDIA